MKHCVLLILACFFCLSSDAAKKRRIKKKAKVAASTTSPTKVFDKSNAMRLCDAVEPQPAWFLEVARGFTFPKNFQAPANYRLISTIDTTFQSFLNGIPDSGTQRKITLPLYLNQTLVCKDFIINRTRTMDSALQARFPFLQSFKAYASDNGLNAARIECDENSVRVMITYDQKQYFVQSVNWQGKKYYACYAKDDPNFVKDKFER